MIYDPQEDSYLIQKHIKRYATGPVLDMGTGSGILAKEAYQYTKQVTAVDINKEAVEYAKENSDKGIIFIHSDLFEKIKQKYKLIIFNPPYLPEEKAEDYSLRQITAGGRHGYELIERFLDSANEHLLDNGRILMVFSSLTNKDKVDEIIDRCLFRSTLLETQMLPMFEQLFLYLIEKTAILKSLSGISELKFFAKGHRGYIYTGKASGKKIAIKLKNPKSKASGRIKNEVRFLKIINKKGIGPKLLKSANDYFTYEFVEGPFLPQYIKEEPKKEAIKKVLIDVIKQCHELDKLKINKEEMHHPHKHIVVGAKPVLLDFERAIVTNKPHNVTQFCQYLCTIKPDLKKKGVFVNITKLRDLSRDYKKSYSLKVLDSIIRSIL